MAVKHYRTAGRESRAPSPSAGTAFAMVRALAERIVLPRHPVSALVI